MNQSRKLQEFVSAVVILRLSPIYRSLIFLGWLQGRYKVALRNQLQYTLQLDSTPNRSGWVLITKYFTGVSQSRNIPALDHFKQVQSPRLPCDPSDMVGSKLCFSPN